MMVKRPFRSLRFYFDYPTVAQYRKQFLSSRFSATRSGLAQQQIIILAAVIAVVALLSVGLFTLLRNASNAQEDNAAKNTVDRVLSETETYWQRFSLQRDGSRHIDFDRWCTYLNRKFATGSDLVLRSARLQGGSVLTDNGFADIEDRFTLTAEANCNDPNLSSSRPENRLTSLDASPFKHGQAMSVWQEDGLGQSNGVLLIRPVELHSVFWKTGKHIPDGTNVNSGGSNRVGKDLDVISVAVISSTGTTYCAVQVLDAEDSTKVGVYRYVQQPGEVGPYIPGACISGSNTVGVNPIAAGEGVNEPWNT